MKTPEQILEAAKKIGPKESLAPHETTIQTLRKKGFSWREVAQFLNEHGIETDHSKVFRFTQRLERAKVEIPGKFFVPTKVDYLQALRSLKISKLQGKMLSFHFHAHNRMATYTELAKAGGSESYGTANLHYGKLGFALGERLKMTFAMLNYEDPKSIYYSSAIGAEKRYGKAEAEWVLIMHHELGKAIEELGLEWLRSISE